MKFSQLLPRVAKILPAFRIGGKRGANLSRLDFAILEVAVMVAALDGEVLESEYDAFLSLAKKCRGYTAANAKKCLDEALRKAGYLALIAKVGSYTAKQRVEAFVRAAVETMPRGFADGELADVRRAFVLWVSMGVSDGDFSDLERRAIIALQDRFAQASLECAAADDPLLNALSPTFCTAYGVKARQKHVTLLENGFVEKAEALVRDLSVASKRQKAEAALAAFIAQA